MTGATGMFRAAYGGSTPDPHPHPEPLSGIEILGHGRGALDGWVSWLGMQQHVGQAAQGCGRCGHAVAVGSLVVWFRRLTQ